MKECLKVWGLRYKDAKGSPQKFSIVYTNLTKKGIQFPTNYFFFPNKDKQDNKEQKGEVPGQVTDQRVLAIIDKLRKNFENLEQEFYYNAQDLEEDPDFPDKSPVVNVNQQKAPVTQLQSQPQAQVQVQNPAQSQSQVQQSVPPEEELLPLMYNAQDLEVDGPDEYLYGREEVSNVKENRKVEKIIENPMEKSTPNNTKVSEAKYQNQIQGPTGRNQNEIQANIGSSCQNNERNIVNNQVIKERIESKGEIEDVKIKIDPNSIEEHVQGKTKLPLSQVGSLMESNRVRNDGSMTFKPGKDMSQSERNQGQGASSGQVEESLGNKKEKSILDLWKPKKPSEIQIPEYEPPNRTEDELPSTQQIKEINIKIQKDLIPTEEDERKNKAKKSIVDSRLEILSNYEKSEIKSMLSEPDSRKVADIRNSPPAGNKNINFPAQNKPPKLETPPARHQEDRIFKKESPQQEKVRKRESPRAEKVIKKETPPFKKENVEVHRLKSNNIETYQSIESEREERAFYKPQREGSSKGNVDIQRLKSGTIESYQSLDGDRSLSLKQRISPKSNTEREPKKKDSFEVFQSRSGNIGSYQSLEGERERKNTSILKQKDRISPKSGPFIPDRDLLELKQRNEFLATENQEIKARLKDLEHKMRDESEKTKLLQEQIEKRENSSFHGSILRCNNFSLY